MYYDFAKIKADIPIERSLIYLKLKFTKDENGWRLDCPKCGGERSIAINPLKNVFFCHDAETGGDVLSFVSHVLDVGVKEAARFLLDHSGKPEAKRTVPPKSEERPKTQPATDAFQPLSHLVFEHDMVQDLGISVEDAEALGIGYTNRGLLKGHVCVPVRLPDGVLTGYVGIHKGKVPLTWHYPKSNVVHLKKRA